MDIIDQNVLFDILAIVQPDEKPPVLLESSGLILSLHFMIDSHKPLLHESQTLCRAVLQDVTSVHL